MKRRFYLATTAALASVSLAGCSMIGDETRLPFPSEERSSEVVRLMHNHNDRPVVEISFAYLPSAPSTCRLQTTISQPAETTIERTEFHLETESADDNDDHPLFVRPAGAHHSDGIEIFREDDRIEIHGRDHGRETVSYELLADLSMGDGEWVPVTVGYEVEIAERNRLGDTFVAHHRTTLPFG